MGLRLKPPRLPRIHVPVSSPVVSLAGWDPIKDIKDKVEDVVKDAGDAAGDVVKGASDAVGDVAKGVGDVVEDVVDVAGDALDDAAKIVKKGTEDVASAAIKAIDDIARLPKKVGDELEEELRKVSSALEEARRDVVRETGGAISRIADAAKAAARFSVQSAMNPLKTVDGAFHQRDVVASLWFLATNPIKETNKNAMRATQDSVLLAAAAQIAATAYGGPAGAAAYATWAAYDVSGGDFNAAIRAGVTTGLIAAATGAVAKMPLGAERTAAETTLKAAVAKAQGQSDEETARAAIASLVQVASGQVSSCLDQSQLDKVEKAIVSGALGGAAIAANGGNSNDVRDAFLKTGGDVLVQGVRSKADDIANTAKDSATEFINRAIDIKELEEQLANVEAAAESVDTFVANTKLEFSAVIDAARSAANDALSEAAAERAKLQSQVDAARARLLLARDDAESRIRLIEEEATKARDQIQAQINGAVKNGMNAEKVAAIADAELGRIKEKADSFVAACQGELAEIVEVESKIAIEGQLRLEETRTGALNELLRADDNRNTIALSNDWILSWDPEALKDKTGDVGVVLTYAGPGSDIDGLVDKIENPDEPN